MDQTGEDAMLRPDITVCAFILSQLGELSHHSRYLREVLGRHLSDQEVFEDWMNRYAAHYREVGNALITLLESDPRSGELFMDGMRQIMEFKWIESGRAGYDVGLRSAGEAWLNAHFDEWYAAVKDAPRDSG
jgi:hypothetical protein